MDKLMVIILTIGPTIICWKILKATFSSLFSGKSGAKMLFGKLPLIGGSKEPEMKAMSSLAGPISNPETAVPSMTEGKEPKARAPWNGAGSRMPSGADTGGAGVGAVVGLVNVIGAMPQTGNVKNMGLRTITGFMPQSGMIYNRARRFGAVNQNAGQIVNQMRGGRLTMNQAAQSQGQFTTKDIKVIGAGGTSVYNAKRIRTIRGANGTSIYQTTKGLKLVKGATGTSIYNVGRSIKRINGVRGYSTYNSGNGIKDIRDINGISNIAIHGEVRRLKAPNSNNAIYAAKFSRKLRRRSAEANRQVLTAPSGTLRELTSGVNNIGLAVNDFYMPRVHNFQSAHYNVHSSSLTSTIDARKDPKNRNLTTSQLNKFVQINRRSQEDERFKDLQGRDRENVQDLFRYGAQQANLSSDSILDIVSTVKKLDEAQTRRERAHIADKINNKMNPNEAAKGTLEKMLQDTKLENNFNQYIESNLKEFTEISEEEKKQIQRKAKENVEKDENLTPKQRDVQYKKESKRLEEELKGKKRTDVEEVLKNDMIENPELLESILGKKAAEKVTESFEDYKKKMTEAISTAQNAAEMKKDANFREQNLEKYGNMSWADIREERRRRELQSYFDKTVAEKYPGYDSVSPNRYGQRYIDISQSTHI